MPPYARAGLYKQLATLKDLVREFREDPVKNVSLRPVIAAQMQQAGLYKDLPYPGRGENSGDVLTAEDAEEMPAEGQVRCMLFFIRSHLFVFVHAVFDLASCYMCCNLNCWAFLLRLRWLLQGHTAG